MCAKLHNDEIVKALLFSGANPNIVNKNQQNVAASARFYKNNELESTIKSHRKKDNHKQLKAMIEKYFPDTEEEEEEEELKIAPPPPKNRKTKPIQEPQKPTSKTGNHNKKEKKPVIESSSDDSEEQEDEIDPQLLAEVVKNLDILNHKIHAISQIINIDDDTPTPLNVNECNSLATLADQIGALNEKVETLDRQAEYMQYEALAEQEAKNRESDTTNNEILEDSPLAGTGALCDICGDSAILLCAECHQKLCAMCNSSSAHLQIHIDLC